MEIKDGVKALHAKSRKEWRKWLEKNHQSERSVRLIIHKKDSEAPGVYYPEAVEEALCFGWIDGKANKRDANSYYQSFSQRKPGSNWSQINKSKVARLIRDGLMTPAGMDAINTAKKNGKWAASAEVENVTIP
ncbi:MAG: hypothetical protein C0490_24880, partial [Marivirga sp.]|nr:hypothetical protein [Marivirga sp.]